MRSDRLESTGADTNTKTVSKGANTKITASNIVSVILTSLSMSNKSVPFLSNTISLFQAFVNQYGASWATGSSSDFLSVRLIYNNIDQWTYASINSTWRLGLVTQYVKITNIRSDQHYWNSKTSTRKTHTTQRNPGIIMKSAHYDSPWATAYQWMNSPKTEYISWKIGSVTYRF